MKDSSKLLNFNVDRDLGFKVFRGVDFKIRRNLAFDLNRDLFFDPDRDLGFGKRGVVFRGYVCPICGAPVAKDASECDECGVQFQKTVSRKQSREQRKAWSRGEREKGITKQAKEKPIEEKYPAKPPSVPQRRSTFQCPVCGKLLYVGAESCPGCNVTFSVKGSKQQKGMAAQPPSGDVYCTNCSFRIPPTDKFCRRCGSPRPNASGRTTVGWDEYLSKN